VQNAAGTQPERLFGILTGRVIDQRRLLMTSRSLPTLQESMI
jgi:hypothetical protein